MGKYPVQSPTGLKWPYPLSSPSQRFLRMNNFVRSLDVRYNAFSGAQKSEWKNFSDEYPWIGYCLENIYDFPEGGFVAQGGLPPYRTVNTWLLDQGFSVTDVPPVVATAYDNDIVSLTYAGAWFITWTGRSSPPVGLFSAELRLAVSNHIPDYGPAVSKFRFYDTVPLSYGVPTEIFAGPPVPPPVPTMATYTLGVAVGDQAAGPFFGVRLNFV